MPQTVLGLFNDREHAESAIDHLNLAGYNPKDMSIVMKDKEEARGLGESTGANVAGGAATGATTGAVIGGLAGLLIGIGTIAIPGIGGLLIGGPIAAAIGLSGAAATTAEGALTGAIAGGLVGALVGLGLPKEHAKHYEERIKQGAILLAVPATDGKEQEAFEIMSDHGASDLQMINMQLQQSDNHAHTHHSNDEHQAFHEGYSHNQNYGEVVNSIQIQKFLKHVDYPASKNDLIDAAKKEGADHNVLYTLEELPDQEFEGPVGVNRAIGDIK